MKTKLFLLLLFVVFIPSIVFGATYYADTSGSGTDCSVGTPCTLDYCVETKAGSGDTCYLNDGTYSITESVDVPDGVNIQGESESGVILKWVSMPVTEELIRLETGTTAITISYMTLDGESSSRRGLRIERSNVTAHHITLIDDFAFHPISVQGPPAISATCAGTYIENIELYNITSTESCVDCSYGTIAIGGVDGISIHDCNIDENSGVDQDGITYSGDYGCIKNAEIYDNIIDTGENDDGLTFAIELWDLRTDSKIYNNTIDGHLNVDRCSKDGGTYSVEIYNNTIYLDTQSSDEDDAGISTDDDIADMRIYGNYIYNHQIPIDVFMSSQTTYTVTNLDIFNNVFYNNYAEQILFHGAGSAAGDTASNINIYNNVFDGITASVWAMSFMDVQTLSGINAKNNIIINYTGGLPGGCYQIGTASNIAYQYNFYDNNDSDSFSEGTGCSVSNLTDSNHVTAGGAPDIVGAGGRPYPYYRLKSSRSDLFDAGVDVGLDYKGAAPDIGAYEFGNKERSLIKKLHSIISR